ncbi:MAG TPA: hypothetical protein VHF02_11220 [Luteimonas sp.]|nr:hypothetical protein [Luteimonas sp.]
MADNDKKSVAHVVPAILTGAAALIAALTTVYINVRGDKSPQGSPVATTATTTPHTNASASARLRLQVDRIAVQHDGSIGTTDWRFAVAADGQPLFVFRQDDLDETGGRNVALPTDAAGNVQLAAGKSVNISIEGWRGSRLRLAQGEPDIRGKGVLSATGEAASIKVQADQPDAGAFVFYFSAARVDDTH